MERPKLIGMFQLDIPHIKRDVETDTDEMISRVAVDEHGGMWGLVVRATKIPYTGALGRSQLLRMRYVRFHKLADVEFVSENPIDVIEGTRK